jgi:hypothetical protein
MIIGDQDDHYVGPPTDPDVGPPIPGKKIGNVEAIVPDDIPVKVVTPEEEAKARALQRALRKNGDRGSWGTGF